MFSILNRALLCAITSFGNKFCLKMRSRLIKALNNRFCVKFMQLEIGLLFHEKLKCIVLAANKQQDKRLISLRFGFFNKAWFPYKAHFDHDNDQF